MCEDFPCCGHESGCCPDFDCNQYVTVELNSRYSICESCMNQDELE